MTAEWVPISDAATRLGLKVSTISQWVRGGLVEHTMIEATPDQAGRARVKAVRLVDVWAWHTRGQQHPAPMPAGPPACTIEGCDKPAIGKGWCSAHDHRARRTGHPLTPTSRGADLMAEFWHLASLIGPGQAITRIADVYGLKRMSFITRLQREGWEVSTDHLGRTHLTHADPHQKGAA